MTWEGRQNYFNPHWNAMSGHEGEEKDRSWISSHINSFITIYNFMIIFFLSSFSLLCFKYHFSAVDVVGWLHSNEDISNYSWWVFPQQCLSLFPSSLSCPYAFSYYHHHHHLIPFERSFSFEWLICIEIEKLSKGLKMLHFQFTRGHQRTFFEIIANWKIIIKISQMAIKKIYFF